VKQSNGRKVHSKKDTGFSGLQVLTVEVLQGSPYPVTAGVSQAKANHTLDSFGEGEKQNKT